MLYRSLNDLPVDSIVKLGCNLYPNIQQAQVK